LRGVFRLRSAGRATRCRARRLRHRQDTLTTWRNPQFEARHSVELRWTLAPQASQRLANRGVRKDAVVDFHEVMATLRLKSKATPRHHLEANALPIAEVGPRRDDWRSPAVKARRASKRVINEVTLGFELGGHAQVHPVAAAAARGPRARWALTPWTFFDDVEAQGAQDATLRPHLQQL